MTMTRLRCCEQPENLRESWRVSDTPVTLVCCVCGTTLALADNRFDLFADY